MSYPALSVTSFFAEDDGGISGIISGQGPVFITDGGGGSDVFRSADAGQYIIQVRNRRVGNSRKV